MGNEKSCNNCNQALMGCLKNIINSGECRQWLPIPKPEAKSLRKNIEELCWNVHCDKLLYTKATDQILELAREKVMRIIATEDFTLEYQNYREKILAKLNKAFGKE